MKFILPSIVSALFVGSALAQTVAIGFPFDGASVKAGKNITVEIDRPDTLSGSTEVAVVLGLVSCPNSACPPPGEILGSILYNGPYNPQFHNTAPPFKPPHQNFTVTVPASFAKGTAQLAAFHVALIGAGLSPFTEIRNITLKVQ